ncbi:hypothetical protein FAZ79_07955 [Guyparkeria sp. SB14A]|uniref:uroporphyrinogen-III C-methyltransferase n=1 Tax=Guyparkeria sp. SB14A TaxID=2571147 RepID=UPI0010ABCCB5|nr:uroporphyrinogen-III C-methyltransferase [Guyparkeria sp. SB14A]TKA88887.1 hypothetical protein FAZ79_07955 [Guyparkeria sp. SB14A]
MDKKDNDKQAEETRAKESQAKESQAKETGAGTSARAGKTSASSNASTSSATAGNKDKGQNPGDKSQSGKGDAQKAAAQKPTAKGGAKPGEKPAASGKSEPPSTTGGDKTAGDKPKDVSPTQTSESDASAGETAKGKGANGGGKQSGGAKVTASAGRPRRSATPWLVIGLLVLFALAAVGGWQLWQLQQTVQSQASEQAAQGQALGEELEQQVARLDDELGSTRSAVSALEDRGDAIREEVESGLQAQQDELAERQDHLDERIARIDDRLSRGEIAWKTAEIGFLLTRAQERLTIGRDPDGAMLALRLADQRVAALSRPHWLPLRSAISDAITEIEATGEGDRVGQALALRRLTDRVEDWPLADEADTGDSEPAEAAAETPEPGESLPEDAAWYEKAWAATRGWVAGQVSVTRSDTPTQLRERVATDREMRLWLTAVRESLLSRDQDALSTTLEEARGWLESHYATDADGPAKALEALKQTRERFASRDFPSIDAVLDAWERANAREKARADSVDVTAETGKEDPS